MRYLSVCSGIEAASAAWHPLGWEAAAFSEIEAFPRAVLKHHYPEVPCHGDFTTIGADDYGPIELLVGGTPCQDFSVAGLRAGIAGERGNLTLEFLRLAARKKPAWIVWENVPGVLSSDGGRALGAFLGGLAELGYGFVYRVLDAQYFGLAQRRARVFVVGYLGDWRRAAAVLFERESLRWDTAPRREAGERTAHSLTLGTGGGSGHQYRQKGNEDALISVWPAEIAPTLNASFGDKQGLEDQHALNGGGLFVSAVTHASEDEMGRGTPLVPVAFDTTQITSAANYSNPRPGDPCHPLAAGAHPPAVAFDLRGREGGAQFEGPHDTANIRAADGGSSRSYVASTAVRRLTPRECERLQGFQDDYTLVPYRGKPAADGPRYKALGNSMAVPCMAWIGRRIEAAEGLEGGT